MSRLSPMRLVGAKVRLRKYVSGYQYQYWVNMVMPTRASVLCVPERLLSWMVTFLPPASSTPAAKMAPILHMVSSCLSEMMRSSCLRKLPTWLSGCCSISMAMPRYAPCRTKSTASVRRVSRRACASTSPVPAHPMPRAMAVPYRTWGLYDSARRATVRGSCSGRSYMRKPKQRTAARRTSSLASLTAWESSLWMAWLLDVPR
mmetsp:Transcript_19466/g.54721  ORF Transcript_19466/g.54721 Transcript_19466/m.54721 type:complete len:203 (-) Transcript_19466:1778-2386(-)